MKDFSFEEQKKVKFYFLITFIITVVTAIRSTGFHHFDEHFQIFEFLNYKLGNIPASNLAWEYEFQMRSFVQPALYYFMAKVLFLEDPFYIAFFARLFTGLIGWWALCYFSLTAAYFYKEKKAVLYSMFFILFCWYTHYLNVRPSSEGLGGTMLMLGFGYFMHKKNHAQLNFKTLFISGFLITTSFWFRFQLGISIFFLWLWMIFILKLDLKSLVAFPLGVIFAVILEIPFDYWGYGELTFAPWNYLYENLILGKANNFPTGPWWEYFRTSFARGIPPLSIVLIFSQIFYWIKRPKCPMTWLTASLVIIHLFIANKAFRYFFPIIVMTPMTLMFTYESLKAKLGFLNKAWAYKFLIGMNLVLLFQITLRSAKPAVNFYEFIYRNNEIKTLVHDGENPFTMVGLPVSFFTKKELSLTKVENIKEIDTNLYRYVFTRRGHEMQAIKEKGCVVKYSTYPLWTLRFNPFNWQKRSRVWALLDCHES